MRFYTRTSAAVLVVVASVLFLASTATVSQPGDLISELCKKTSYVDTCITTVKENIMGEITGIAVLTAEIDASIKAANVAVAQVANLTKSASGKEKVLLSACNENFKSSICSLMDAKTAVEERNATGVNFHVNQMEINAFACDESYTNASIPSPLIEVDRLLIHLGGNCFVIAAWVGLGVS